MEIRVRENGTQFCYDVLCKLYGLGIGNIKDIGTDASVYPHLRSAVGMATVLRVCCQCGNEMSGHVHLGKDIDMSFGCVTDNVLHLLLGIVERSVLAVGLCTLAGPVCLAVLYNLGDGSIVTAFAFCTGGGEQRILLYLGSPALVIGQMPVEHVHLVDGHQVKHLLYLLHGEEMTANVKHEATVGKARFVLYAGNGQRIGNARLALLP